MAELGLLVTYRDPDGVEYQISGDVDVAAAIYRFFKVLPEDVSENEFTIYLIDPDTGTILDMKNLSEGLLDSSVPDKTIDELNAGGEKIEMYLDEVERNE